MKPILEYKGYLGSADVNIEDGLIHGRLLYINDVVSYVSSSPKEIETAFRDAVDDYLETCHECGDKPDVPFKGSLNIRLGPELHRAAALDADKCGAKLNDWIKAACQEKLEQRAKEPRMVTHQHQGELKVRILVEQETPVTQFSESEDAWAPQLH
jgi:predicted HicB family RNase H-like nuclease